jgi:hypothetical protein
MVRSYSSVHGKGAAEITASSVYPLGSAAPHNVVDFKNQYSDFDWKDQPSQWIYWDFKTLKIEPTHYTI